MESVMPAVTREAILRKQANRKSKKDIERELKIKELGGEVIDIKYGEPLTREDTDKRVEYMYDLMYPSRLLPPAEKLGRPTKYDNAQERS